MGKNVNGTFSLSFKEPPMALASRCCCTVSYYFLHKWYHRGGEQRNNKHDTAKIKEHGTQHLYSGDESNTYRINNLTHD